MRNILFAAIIAVCCQLAVEAETDGTVVTFPFVFEVKSGHSDPELAIESASAEIVAVLARLGLIDNPKVSESVTFRDAGKPSIKGKSKGKGKKQKRAKRKQARDDSNPYANGGRFRGSPRPKAGK